MRTKIFLAVLLPLCLAAPFDDIANYEHSDVSQVKFNEQLRLLFKIMDIDQNRLIDAEELMLICLENDIDIPAAEAERIVTLPGFLTMDKFVELLADCPSDKTADILLYLVHTGGNGNRRERIHGFFNTWKSQFTEQIRKTKNKLFQKGNIGQISGEGTTVSPTTKEPSSDIETEEAQPVLPSPSSQQNEGYGKCSFTHDCRRDENQHCKYIADASCICNHGTCVIRGHVLFGPRKSECKTLQDCKNAGKCSGVPDSQCFCIDEQCESRTQWECHETSDCAKMAKCRGKDCTCEDGTCEWNCFTDNDCNNGPFYCDPLGYHCKCQNSKCDLVKLPTQCKEASGDGLRECVQKSYCKKDEPCQCLQDFCTKPWYVEKNVEIPGGPRDFNCRTTQDCTETILDCANDSCVCGDIVDTKWNKRGTCIKKTETG